MTMGQSGIRLHRWELWRDGDGGSGLREVSVDYRSALTDALLSYDVPTGDVVRKFERLIADPSYEEKR